MPIVNAAELRELLNSQIQPSVLHSISLTSLRTGQNSFAHKQSGRVIQLKNEEKIQWTLHDATGRQTHENISWKKSLDKLHQLLGPVYRNLHMKTVEEEIQIRFTKKDKIQLSRNKHSSPVSALSCEHDQPKQYLFPEGKPIPFLVSTGIMSASGKVHRSMYRKFRQINRFAEIVYDLRDQLPTDRPVKIVDYGCGKSYLSFAVRQLLVDRLGLKVDMFGLDSNADVIASCNQTKQELNLNDIQFVQSQITEAKIEPPVDLAIWLHACDTATDDALACSVKWNAEIILASPCCQHELHKQLDNNTLHPLLKQGILRERFAAIATDAMRSQLLEAVGYRSQIKEFIDMEHTAKNLLIRANRCEILLQQRKKSLAEYFEMKDSLSINKFHLEAQLREFLPID